MITSKLLANLFPYTPKAKRDRFIPALNKFLPKYKINTAKRVRAFLAVGGFETDYLKVTIEYASGTAYEGRDDLGNTQKGDGKKFKGRGFFQTTGRYNYGRVNKRCGAKLGIDFLKNPERLAEIDIAIESACIFWEENDLNKYADAENFFALSGVVNRGSAKKKALHYDGSEGRKALYDKCCNWIADNFAFVPEDTAEKDDIDNTGNGDGVQGDNSITTATAEPTSTTPPEPSISAASEISDGEKSAIREKADKFILHCKTDSAKNIALTISARIVASITGLWGIGIHGKLFLIIISLAVIGFTLYAFFKYRARFTAWIKAIFESLFS